MERAERLETDRLLLRRTTEDDFDGFALVHTNAARELNAAVRHWSDHGFGPWSLFDRESGEFVGVVEVHYAGNAWSTRQQFDASWDRGDTFTFRLGAGQVIGGWDQGVAGMKVGGRRRLVIPPDLGYGSRGAGGVIKPNETLVFVVDLIGLS